MKATQPEVIFSIKKNHQEIHFGLCPSILGGSPENLCLWRATSKNLRPTLYDHVVLLLYFCLLKNKVGGSGEISQQLRVYFLSKHEDLSSNVKHPCKNHGMVVCISVNLVLLRVKSRGSLEFSDVQHSSRFIERPCLKGLREGVIIDQGT